MNLEAKNTDPRKIDEESADKLVRAITEDLSQRGIDNILITNEAIGFLAYLKSKLAPGERISISLFDSERISSGHYIVRTETDLVIIRKV